MELLSIILSALALFGALFTYISHDRKLKKQEKLLNEYQLRALVQDEEENKKAVIRAKAIKTANGHRTLYIYNTGKAIARNLTVQMVKIEQVYATRPAFPQTYPELLPDAYRMVQLMLIEGNDVLTLNYCWEDDFKNDNKESQTIDL